MGLTVLHQDQEDKALIFSFGPFGSPDNQHDVVCCLRTHPRYPAEISLDVIPVPLAGVKPGIASLWNLPDEREAFSFSDPFGVTNAHDHSNREEWDVTTSDPTLVQEAGLPGQALSSQHDITGRRYVPGEEEIGIRHLYPLNTDRLPDLSVYCLTGEAGKLLTRIVDIMQTEKGLLPEECPEINEDDIQKLTALIATEHTGRYRQAADLFEGCRDERTCRTIDWYANDQDLGWRKQAAGEYPLLAGLLAREPETREAIDCARPLLPALRKVFPNLTKGGLKRLRGIDRQDVTQTAVCGLEAAPLTGPDILGHLHDRQFILTGEWEIREAIRELTQSDNPSIIPATTEDWNAFAILYAGFIRPMKITMDIDPGEIIRGSKGQWGRMLNQIGSVLELNESQPLDRHQAVILVADMLEMCNQLARTVILPAMTALVHQHVPAGGTSLPQHDWPFKPELGRSSFRIARDILMTDSGRNPLLHCSRLIRRWTPRINHLNNIMANHASAPEVMEADDTQTERWASNRDVAEPLTEAFILNDVTFTPLHTAGDLAREGKDMKHCIATYKRSLVNGDSVFYHLQKGSSKATLCLKAEDGMRFRRNGFNGVKNARPARDLENTVTRFINGLNGQQVAIREEFVQWRGWTRKNSLQQDGEIRHFNRFANFCSCPRDALLLNRIDSASGLPRLTRELWEEWSMIAKCHTHPFKLIVSHPDNPLRMFMRKTMPKSFYDDLRTLVIQKTNDLTNTDRGTLTVEHDRPQQPVIN